MAKIHRLNEHLTNMIAAGEVVERPMGIVKECVENSIDAHASAIEIHIEEGGLNLIRIIDDGDGMDFHDAKMAFERHATSKISQDHDLWNIHTLGFRGEAIPSIASVAQVDIKTNDGHDSTLVSVYYGQLVAHKPYATPKGTQIDIRNLFQKTPARYKHLKTTQYEFSLINDVVQKFAFAYPNIAFKLFNNGIEVFKTSGNGRLQEVIMQVYGRETAKLAIPLSASDDDFTITGYAIQPSINRATKYYMLVYLNNRMVRSQRLTSAIKDAYSAYMPHDRYPIVVLNVQMDAQLVDVNVHPSKWEVRLSKEKQCENLIYKTISDALREKLQVPEAVPVKQKQKIEMPAFDFESAPVYEVHKQIHESFSDDSLKQSIEKLPEIPTQSSAFQDEKREEKSIEVKSLLEYNPSIQKEERVKEAEAVYYTNQEDVKHETSQQEKECIHEPVNPSFPELIVIGQFRKSYILAQGEKGLYIIDQHAAQEKYHYEVLRRNIYKPCEHQPLLIPEIIQVTPAILVQLKEINEVLEKLQIQLECFGEDSVLLREIPIWLKDTELTPFIQDLLDFYQDNQKIDPEKLRKAVLASIACHSSIRFNRNLTLDEMKQVVEDLRKCDQPFHCPHGRPTLICITDSQLEKDFYRSGV